LQLDAFARSFDVAEAKQHAKVTPAPGVNGAYDEAVADIASLTAEIDAYLVSQRTALKCSALEYWGSAKDRFQIEVPESVASRVPSTYMLKSKRKGAGKKPGVWRCESSWRGERGIGDSAAQPLASICDLFAHLPSSDWTPTIVDLLDRLTHAEARRDDAIKDSLRALCSSFDDGRPVWEAAVSCVATLDCLCALALWSARGDGGQMCRPVLLPLPTTAEEGPVLDLIDGRHPGVALSHLASAASSSQIPNDVRLGGSGRPACILLTGPNMGGKSTAMRMASVCTVLAQLGAYVPARACRLTPVDRIFTRVGASDRILAGQSTFFVVSPRALG
jgi:DNA mismatch repair protein MSH6